MKYNDRWRPLQRWYSKYKIICTVNGMMDVQSVCETVADKIEEVMKTVKLTKDDCNIYDFAFLDIWFFRYINLKQLRSLGYHSLVSCFLCTRGIKFHFFSFLQD